MPRSPEAGLRIMGLDPGSIHTGYGVIERHGSSITQIAHGRLSPERGEPLAQRLAFLTAGLDELLERWRPGLVVFESLFSGPNVRSLIVMAQARGALLSIVARRGLEIREYSPAEIKSAVTGNGRAGKEQVSRMVRLLLALGDGPLPSDTTDALAVAICAGQRLRFDRRRFADRAKALKN